MKQQVEITLGSLREEIALRKQAIHLLEEDVAGLQLEIDQRRAAIAKLNEEITKINQVSEVLGKSALLDIRALLNPEGLPTQEAVRRRPFNLRRDYTSVFIKVLLYLGCTEWFTLKQIMTAVKELELVAPHQYHTMRSEPGKLVARQEFPVLERKSSGVHTHKYVYHLTEQALIELRNSLGDLDEYRGNSARIKGLPAQVAPVKKVAVTQPTAA